MATNDWKEITKLLVFVIIFFVAGAIGDSIANYFFGFFVQGFVPNMFMGKSLGDLLIFIASGAITDWFIVDATNVKINIKI
jgi:hypothetical protein